MIPPFEQKIALLCHRLKLSKSQLGVRAGLSHATIAKWVKHARAGTLNPRSAELAQLAEFAGVSPAWLLATDEVAMAPAPLDTKALAEQAATMLEELDGVEPDRAWLLLRGVTVESPTVAGYYAAARQRMAAAAPSPRKAPKRGRS